MIIPVQEIKKDCDNLDTLLAFCLGCAAMEEADKPCLNNQDRVSQDSTDSWTANELFQWQTTHQRQAATTDCLSALRPHTSKLSQQRNGPSFLSLSLSHVRSRKCTDMNGCVCVCERETQQLLCTQIQSLFSRTQT